MISMPVSLSRRPVLSCKPSVVINKQVAAAIATVYWSMVLFMPSLILRAPETGEWKSTSASEVPDLIRIPVKLDLALHAIPGTTLVLDFFLFERKYPKGQARLGGAAVALVAGLWYSCWAEYCASFNGICESNLQRIILMAYY